MYMYIYIIMIVNDFLKKIPADFPVHSFTLPPRTSYNGLILAHLPRSQQLLLTWGHVVAAPGMVEKDGKIPEEYRGFLKSWTKLVGFSQDSSWWQVISWDILGYFGMIHEVNMVKPT